MTSHALARLLLEEPDMPVVGLDDYFGYFDLEAVFPVMLVKNTNKSKWMSQLDTPKTRAQGEHAYTALVIS